MEKAVKETIIRVKRNSIEEHSKQANATDLEALMRIVEERRALEKLEKLYISIE